MNKFCLLYFLSNILAFEDNTRLGFVTDRTIKKILKDDETEATDIELIENAVENYNASKFIWDKYNLKPEFYHIECWEFLDSTTENKLLLKCFSDKNEEMFKFEIESKNGNFQEVNFYNTDNNKQNFTKVKEKGHEYYVSSREENIKSIRNNFIYMRKAPEIRPLCQVIIIKFYKFIKTFETIRYEAIRCKEYDESFILKIWEVEKYVFGIINTLFKTFSSLLIPSTNKFEFVKSYDDVKKSTKKIYYMIKSLKERFNLEILLNLKKKKEESQFAWQKKFVKDADSILEDLKDDSPDSINRNYNKLIKNLQFLDSLAKKDTDNNEVKDLITVDCDIKTVDKFVEKYSSFLLEYCEIMANFDEVLLNKFFFECISKYENSKNFRYLEDMHDDILIARELKKCVLNYENDKIDFLIFSQTDYFKNRLSEKVKFNLEYCYNILLSKNYAFRNLTRKSNIEFSEDDRKCLKRIEKLQKDLISAFNSNDPSEQQTFQKIISNLENPVQNNNAPSRTVSDDVSQNANIGQSEDNNNENQESIKTSEQTNLDTNQNSNNEQTSDETKLEENPSPLENNTPKDESNQTVSEISKDTNLDTSKNDNTQESGQELNKDIIVKDNSENKNSKSNDEENVKILSDNKQNPKESSNQTDNKINSDEINKSNDEENDRPGQNEAQINISENKLNLDDDQKIVKINKVNDDSIPKEINNEITQKQEGKSTFLDDYLIYIICGCVVVAFGIVGALIYYFKSS